MNSEMFTVPQGRRIYGMQLPVQAQSAYFVADWERTAGPHELAMLVKACDESGFAYVGVCDHVALPESVAGGMGTHWADPIATLSWIAGMTSRVGLLSHVYVLPYRNPRIAAKQFATLDHLSDGRAFIGIGAGHAQAEFELLGIDFHNRGKALDSGIPELAMLLENEFVNGFGARPLPTQSPRPPIWVAGSSPAAIKRAARLGDGWLPQGPSDASMIDILNAEWARIGRHVENFMIGHITPFLYIGKPTFDVGEGTLTGSAQSIAERILAGTASGVNQLQVRFKAQSCQELCDQIAVFAAEVAPFLTTI